MTFFAIPRDDKLSGLTALLDTDLIKMGLAQQINGSADSILHCRVEYVRYKPGRNCIALYAITRENQSGGAPQELSWYGKCFTAEAFTDAYRKAITRHWIKPPVGQPVTSLNEHRIILFAYPNDCSLKSLTILEHEDLLRQFLCRHLSKEWLLPDKRLETTVVRYKPENRAVLRCETGVQTQSGNESFNAAIYLRVYPDGRGATVHRSMCRLLQWLEPRDNLSIPEPLAFAMDQHILLLGSLPGDTLLSTTRTSCAREAFERTAQALAVLHAYYDPEVPRRTVADHLAETRRSIHLLTQFEPELQNQTEELSHVLHARAPRDSDCAFGFVHGDFHYGQVMVSSRKIGLLDFDRAHTGPVAADLGTLLAHLRYLRVKGRLAEENPLTDSFLEAYVKATEKSMDPRIIAWWTALALLQIAHRPIRRLDADGHDKVRKLLEEVKGLLQCK